MDLTSLKSFWDSASEKDKYDLLRGITVHSSRWLEPYFMHSESRKTLGVKEPFRERHLCVPLAPEVVGSDPVAFRDRWVRIAGVVDSNRVQGPWQNDVVWFTIKGAEGPHALRTFAWTSKSRENHRILSDLHKDFAYLKTFVWTYPYDIEKAVLSARNGTRVILYGRLIRNGTGFPMVAFETWAVDVVKDGAKVLRPSEPAPAPTGESTKAEAGALLHARALDLLRSAPPDEASIAAAIEALRDSYEMFHDALAQSQDDVVIQEYHARTLRLLHHLLRNGKMPD